MLHGMTSDPHSEFFIQKRIGAKDASVPSDAQNETEENLGIMGLTGSQLQVITKNCNTILYKTFNFFFLSL